eukprot:CAMPEP_0170104094 /NCGR_PEP_ID=MMETSP0020_2-20130122/3906_1 /TAXON_ID=98059 /ORGANISM="Dinobryon sp., Strain UTEXLB2267" /LENGTH=775 /DNA_ID=CAMNT_0010327829 /DNA_START=547 /DNA_END=2874 /DNA_ORIENTATION=+
MITVNGVDAWGRDQVWQLAAPSEEVCLFWAQALRKARDCDHTCSPDYSGQLKDPTFEEQLKDLALKMCKSVGVRKRFSNFKLYARAFVGSTAVKWIMKDKSCTVSQAVAIGNKMLIHGYISHVSYEHLFCAKNILYRFHSDIDPLVLLPQSRKPDMVDGSDDEDEEHNMLLHEMSNDAISLTLCQKDLKKAHITIEKAFKYTNISLDLLAISQNNGRKSLRALHHYKIAFSVLATIVVFIVLQIWAHYFFQTSSPIILGWNYHYVTVMLVFAIFSAVLFFNILLRLINKPKSAASSEHVLEIERHRTRFIDFQRHVRHTVLKCDESDSEDSSVPGEEDGLHYEQLINHLHDEGEETVPSHPLLPSAKDGGEYPNLSLSLSAEDPYDHDESNNGDESDDNPIFTDDDSEYNSRPPSSSHLDISHRRKARTDRLQRMQRFEQQQPAPLYDSLPLSEPWPNEPILLKRSVGMLSARDCNDSKQMEYLLKPLTIHKAGPTKLSLIPIDNDFFVGKAYIWISHLKDTPAVPFPRQRKFQSVVQGQFKVPVPFSSLYTGQIFQGPFEQLPNKWVMRAALGLIKKLQPGLQLNLEGDSPFLVSPMASTSQAIVVSEPGTEPDITTLKIEENMTLMGSLFDSMTSKQRQAYFSKPQNLSQYTFQPKYVYTFDFYQHLLNFSTFHIDLGFIKYDFGKTLGARPLQVMAVVWNPVENNGIPPETPQYLYNFEVWHRRLIPASESTAFTSGLDESVVGNSHKHSSLKKKSKFPWLRGSPVKSSGGV